MNEIKKIIKTIYNLDYSKCTLEDRDELQINSDISEFTTFFQKRDFNEGIIVTPGGYAGEGLFYSTYGGGELENSPHFMPDIVNFNFDFLGLKKDSWYKLTVICRNTQKTYITKDRTLTVTNDQKELLLEKDLAAEENTTEDTFDNKTYTALFHATSNEMILFFKIGKIIIKDIIVEEVELTQETLNDLDENIETLGQKISTVAYGIFTTKIDKNPLYKGRYINITRYSGRGVQLYYDTIDNVYCLERDNKADTLGESFININYIINFNFNKVVNYKLFNTYAITEVSQNISPNTISQGYLKFALLDCAGNKISCTNIDSRFTITINKIF